jgi:DNA polymerase-3 subunit epsilon
MEIIQKVGEKLKIILEKKDSKFDEILKSEDIFQEAFEIFGSSKIEFITNLKLYGLSINFDTETDIISLNYKNANLKDIEFTIIDLEWTTEKINNKPIESIIEIAGVKIKNNKIIDKFESFIYHEKVEEKVQEITGITSEMLQNAPKRRDILSKFRLFLNDSIVVAHGATNDKRVIKREFERLDMPFLNTILCTFQMSSKVFMTNKYNLDSLNETFKINIESQLHRAMNDAEITYKIFGLIYNYLINKNILTLYELNKWFHQSKSKQSDLLKNIKNQELNSEKSLDSEQQFFATAYSNFYLSKNSSFDIFLKLSDNYEFIEPFFEYNDFSSYGTHQEADYMALLVALEFALQNNLKYLNIKIKNKIIYKQIHKKWKVRTLNLVHLFKKFEELKSQFISLKIELISK